MVAGVATDYGSIIFATPETLAIAWAFVEGFIFVSGNILVGEWAEATGFLGQFGFCLRVFEVEKRVAGLGLSCLLFGLVSHKNIGDRPGCKRAIIYLVRASPTRG